MQEEFVLRNVLNPHRIPLCDGFDQLMFTNFIMCPAGKIGSLNNGLKTNAIKNNQVSF